MKVVVVDITRGERNPAAILNWEKVKEIKTLLIEGYKQSEIAKKYNVGKHVIHAIKTNKTWK